MEKNDQTVRFEIAGVDGQDPLGLWEPAPESPIHFGAGQETFAPPADIPIYRVELHDSGMAADTIFHESEFRLERTARVLEQIPNRLEDLVTRTEQQLEAAESKALHFALEEPGVVIDLAEAELLYHLAALDAKRAVPPTESAQIDFGVLDEVIHPAMEQANSQFKSLLNQINHEVLHYAWVETVLLGQLLARTSVGWSGDAKTIWRESVSAEQIALHRRTLRFATRSRALKMRLAMTITGGAAKVAALMTNPAGAVLVLPAVYRYVKQILSQASELGALKEGVPTPLV